MLKETSAFAWKVYSFSSNIHISDFSFIFRYRNCLIFWQCFFNFKRWYISLLKWLWTCFYFQGLLLVFAWQLLWFLPYLEGSFCCYLKNFLAFFTLSTFAFNRRVKILVNGFMNFFLSFEMPTSSWNSSCTESAMPPSTSSISSVESLLSFSILLWLFLLQINERLLDCII